MPKAKTPKGSSRPAPTAASSSAVSSSAKATAGGPSKSDARGPGAKADPLTAKLLAQDALAAAMPSNTNKPLEYGKKATEPSPGRTVAPTVPAATGSTLTETTPSAKAGAGDPQLGENPANGPLDRVRTDASHQTLTSNQGVPIGDNQSSLKVDLRGPVLLEDFLLREKITHFDHERIPERVVHARGSAAHGYFECSKAMSRYTRASIFAEPGKRTPVFVRFSTVLGERGSTDTARDVRGFAVKFYTDEGNWDLVGNNIPVFFIQDAIKFPDLIHAAKPEPHHGMPQAASAHDTFWDFVSLTPESTHMLLWAMSDRAIPRSYRMMQGFGVHTFRLVNAAGRSTFVKFHWQPKAGTHSLDWDEAVKISGADPDFHRRDLWESIETGNFPEWELGVQLITEEQADKFSFDVLDATKLIPEELAPVIPIGRMVLNRNPDNFFAETEQVAFCTSHVVPGIDFTNDPLLQGRLHSYQDTQISRLGGPNFHEIPINASVAQVHNNQRDGMHRQAINRGRVSYEPNSLGGGCPFQAGTAGFTSFPQPIAGDKVRGKPEKFADHYTQATLFWASQTPIEKEHIVRAFRFELTKLTVPAVRKRVLATLVNVDRQLAASVAKDLGMDLPEALPKALRTPVKAEVTVSQALSLFTRPGDGSVKGRRVAILLADGSDTDAAQSIHDTLSAHGAVPRFVGAKLGKVVGKGGTPVEIEISIEAAPSVLYDALVVVNGAEEALGLANLGQALEFIRDQYRHCKPILALGAAGLLERAGIPKNLPKGATDPGLIVDEEAQVARALPRFEKALGLHRHFARYLDPPAV